MNVILYLVLMKDSVRRRALGGFECFCPNGWTGEHCELSVNDCENVKCLNGGTCMDGFLDFTCLCDNRLHG